MGWTLPANFTAYFDNLTLALRMSMNSNASDRPQRAVRLPIDWRHLSLILLLIWSLAGNLLVIASVLRWRSLQTLSNQVIASLALTDLSVAIVLLPPATYNLVSSRQCTGAEGTAIT